MHIYVIIYNLWCLVYYNKKSNLYDFIFFDEYKYKYILVDKKGRIQIPTYLVWMKGHIQTQIYFGWQKMANTNRNTNNGIGICKYKYTLSLPNAQWRKSQ